MNHVSIAKSTNGGTASIDGGQNWLPEVKIADAQSDQSDGTWSFSYGDYIANSAFGGMSFDAWPDTNVNLDDFNRLAANFGLSGRHWFQGDFDYDTTVNLDDFNLLAANFGQVGLGPGGYGPNGFGNGTYGYTVEDLLEHLLNGGHGLPPR